MLLTSPLRAAAVRHALARTGRLAPSASELELLTQYALGHRSLEQTNDLLQAQGRRLRLAAVAPAPAS